MYAIVLRKFDPLTAQCILRCLSRDHVAEKLSKIDIVNIEKELQVSYWWRLLTLFIVDLFSAICQGGIFVVHSG